MILTTITPYWNRPEILQHWLAALGAASHPDVQHLVLVLDERPPEVPTALKGRMRFVPCQGDPHTRPSIGYLHDIGAKLADTPWIMKLDVDAFPHAAYFARLLHVIRGAKDKEWFNGGMFYLSKVASEKYLHQPLDVPSYLEVLSKLTHISASYYRQPAASNFICRRQDYIDLGGCDPRFQGWGWEDYQQLYMLEQHQLGSDPLPGMLSQDNITQRCRDEISRTKAKALYQRDRFLALLHHYHPINRDPSYRRDELSDANRLVLLHYVRNHK